MFLKWKLVKALWNTIHFIYSNIDNTNNLLFLDLSIDDLHIFTLYTIVPNIGFSSDLFFLKMF